MTNGNDNGNDNEVVTVLIVYLETLRLHAVSLFFTLTCQMIYSCTLTYRVMMVAKHVCPSRLKDVYFEALIPLIRYSSPV